jgi:hypothetical protein
MVSFLTELLDSKKSKKGAYTASVPVSASGGSGGGTATITGTPSIAPTSGGTVSLSSLFGGDDETEHLKTNTNFKSIPLRDKCDIGDGKDTFAVVESDELNVCVCQDHIKVFENNKGVKITTLKDIQDDLKKKSQPIPPIVYPSAPTTGQIGPVVGVGDMIMVTEFDVPPNSPQQTHITGNIYPYGLGNTYFNSSFQCPVGESLQIYDVYTQSQCGDYQLILQVNGQNVGPGLTIGASSLISNSGRIRLSQPMVVTPGSVLNVRIVSMSSTPASGEKVQVMICAIRTPYYSSPGGGTITGSMYPYGQPYYSSTSSGSGTSTPIHFP